MILNQEAKIVEAIAPIDTTGAAQTANHVSLKGYDHCTVIINTGAWAGGTSAVTVQQSTVVAGTDDKALTFTTYYTNDGATATDTLTATACSSTFNLDTANAMYIIEIPAASLDTDNNFACIELNTASPGANADLISATYILSKGRYKSDAAPTGLTD
jgi:hypothetical protein